MLGLSEIVYTANRSTRVKRWLFLFLLIGVANLHALDTGSKIADVLASGVFKYVRSDGAAVPAFNDIEFVSLSQSNDFSRSPVLLSARQNGVVIAVYGVLDGSSSNASFLYDTDGDGVLDMRSSARWYPSWIFFNARMVRADPSSFVRDCQDIYGQLNSVEGPTQATMSQEQSRILDVLNDRIASNRDLYYSLLFYSVYSAEEPQLCLGAMLSVGGYLSAIYKLELPLICLYAGESLIDLGKLDHARNMFERLKQIDTSSLIAEYYLARIGLLNDNNWIPMSRFRSAHPQFWALKDTGR
jgi:hypothetical protein